MPKGGGYSTNLFRSLIFSIIHNYINTAYLLNITFIFGRCHHSLAVVTPAKYEYDSTDIYFSKNRKYPQ